MLLSSALISTARARPGEVFSELLPWLLVLTGVVVAGAIVLQCMRRSMRSGHGDAADGFTLHELRELRASGELSDEEFERAKAAMIERLRPITSENDPEDAPREG